LSGADFINDYKAQADNFGPYYPVAFDRFLQGNADAGKNRRLSLVRLGLPFGVPSAGMAAAGESGLPPCYLLRPESRAAAGCEPVFKEKLMAGGAKRWPFFGTLATGSNG
jgi:hypothetical protein